VASSSDSDAEDDDDSEWKRKQRRFNDHLLCEDPAVIALHGCPPERVNGMHLTVYYDVDGTEQRLEPVSAIAMYYDPQAKNAAGIVRPHLSVVGNGGGWHDEKWLVQLDGDDKDAWHWGKKDTKSDPVWRMEERELALKLEGAGS